jgi:hypothetical protein
MLSADQEADGVLQECPLDPDQAQEGPYLGPQAPATVEHMGPYHRPQHACCSTPTIAVSFTVFSPPPKPRTPPGSTVTGRSRDRRD